MISVIKIIFDILLFALGMCIWKKVVDKIDDFLKNKISDKAYNIVTWITFIIMFVLVIYSIIN